MASPLAHEHFHTNLAMPLANAAKRSFLFGLNLKKRIKKKSVHYKRRLKTLTSDSNLEAGPDSREP
jgi:hypothetical protein